MKKVLFIWLLIFPVLANLCFGQHQAGLVSDGFLLSGVEGKVICDDLQQQWFFEFAGDVNDNLNRVNAGMMLQLLASSALEKLCIDVNERAEPSYRLWGRVTKYKNQNFIFPSYFYPLAKAKIPQSNEEPGQTRNIEEKPEQQITINEPDDSVVIPSEILQKLSGRKIVRTEPVREKFDVQIDTVISDRMAVLMESSDGNFVFVLESLGRNISDISLKVLPSQALELTEQIQASESERTHFKISGLLTKYKGEFYLLLQRASRVYSYQNFAG
jgi:hypothetical protein